MNAYAEVRYLPHARLEQVDSRFDAERGIYWAYMNPRPRACFNRELLSDLSAWVDTIENAGGTLADENGRVAPVHYAVIASKLPGVFNLGGDLALFRTAIERRERSTMRSDHGNPISRCCAGDRAPSATAAIHAGSCASANSPSLAGAASDTRTPGKVASTASRNSRYLDIGKPCPGGSGKTKASE